MVKTIINKLFSENTFQKVLMLSQFLICYSMLFLILIFEYNYFTIEIEQKESSLYNRKLISDICINSNDKNIIAVFKILDSRDYHVYSNNDEIFGVKISNKYYNDESKLKQEKIKNKNSILISNSLKPLVRNNKIIIKIKDDNITLNVNGFIEEKDRIIIFNDADYNRLFEKIDNTNYKFQIVVDNYKSINKIVKKFQNKNVSLRKDNLKQEYEIEKLYSLKSTYEIFKIIFIFIIYIYYIGLINSFLYRNIDKIKILYFLGLKEKKIKLTLLYRIIINNFISIVLSLILIILIIKIKKIEMYRNIVEFLITLIFIIVCTANIVIKSILKKIKKR